MHGCIKLLNKKLACDNEVVLKQCSTVAAQVFSGIDQIRLQGWANSCIKVIPQAACTVAPLSSG